MNRRQNGNSAGSSPSFSIHYVQAPESGMGFDKYGPRNRGSYRTPNNIAEAVIAKVQGRKVNV